MARTNGSTTEVTTHTSAPAEGKETTAKNPSEAEVKETTAKNPSGAEIDVQDIDSSLNALKTLLGTVEKLQKSRQEVGDIKPLLMRLLDGELLAGDEIEQLKSGVNGLFRLVRTYGEYQTALEKAQPARNLLDEVLKSQKSA
jgi:hypothetical protein